MTELISIARAARLAGVKRSELQERIRRGELDAFEGEVALAQIQQLYPDADWEADSEYQRTQNIKDTAFGKRVLERTLPSAVVLAQRLNLTGTALSEAGIMLRFYQDLLDELRLHLAEEAEAHPSLNTLERWLQSRLQQAPFNDRERFNLVPTPQVYRTVPAAVRLYPQDELIYIEGQESLLDAALRAGMELDYGCNNGSCGRCRAQVRHGEVRKLQPTKALTRAAREQGEILLCSYTALSDLEVELRPSGTMPVLQRQEITTRLMRLEQPSAQVTILRLRVPRHSRLKYRPGQLAQVALSPASELRLPIASCPCDGMNIELHLAHRQLARPELLNDLEPGQQIKISDPAQGFPLPERLDCPMMFIALEEGFAAIKPLIEHVMNLDANTPMHLYWLSEQRPYLDNLARAWRGAWDEFRYDWLELSPNGLSRLARISQDHPDHAQLLRFAAIPSAWQPHFSDALRQAGVSLDSDHLVEV